MENNTATEARFAVHYDMGGEDSDNPCMLTELFDSLAVACVEVEAMRAAGWWASDPESVEVSR